MHLAFQIRLVFCFCGGFFAVRNAVGGILDSSHVFKGMGFVKLLKKKTYIIGFLLTFMEMTFFCKCSMSSPMIIILLQII